MQIGINKDIDAAQITLGGAISTYQEAREAVEAIFALAALLWPDDSAAHEAEFGADEPDRANRKPCKPMSAVRPGSLTEAVLAQWDGGLRDAPAIAERLGKQRGVVAMQIAALRAGGFIAPEG